ncbi:MAG: hypothetical protein H0X34_07315 [Chthoniobacterales bacterium]|nr:hypothetical protein [Chthoniobacterales bacterium]
MKTILSVAQVIRADGTARTDCCVFIGDDGEIAEITRESEAADSSRRVHSVLDRRDCTLLPLLADAHIHLGISDGINESPEFHTVSVIDHQLATYLRNGIGHVLSLGTDQQWMVELSQERQRVQVSGLATPFSAGCGFGANGGWPPEMTVPELRFRPTDEATAKDQVRQLAKQGVRVVKLWVDDFKKKVPKVPVPIQRVVIEEAHRNGMKSSAHVFLSKMRAIWLRLALICSRTRFETRW